MVTYKKNCITFRKPLGRNDEEEHTMLTSMAYSGYNFHEDCHNTSKPQTKTIQSYYPGCKAQR